MARLLDGKALSKKIQAELTETIAGLRARAGRSPGLAVLMVGDHPASATYVRNKKKACARIGIESFSQDLPAETTQAELEQLIDTLNQDERVDGILVQLPLPEHLNSVAVLNKILPEKDADGLHPMNMGQLLREDRGLRSCTPAGVMRLLKEYDLPLKGKQAVVIGRSILVGKPMALMLLAADATVTIAHAETRDLGANTRNADILISAVGQSGLITADMVKPGAIVVDVGINRIATEDGKGKLVGDVDFDAVNEVAGWITPVPGGIGPMTVTMLMYNTVVSYRQRLDLIS